MSSKDIFNLGNNILKLFADILSKAIDGNLKNKILNFSELNIDFKKMIKNYNLENINMINSNDDLFNSFNFSLLLLKTIIPYILNISKNIIFNSFYSFLYFMRIVHCLNKLTELEENIIDDPLIKVSLYIIYLFFKDNKEKSSEINEGFFKGTFIEIKNKYFKSTYNDSEQIKNTINKWKEESKSKIIKTIELTFTRIIEAIENYTTYNKNEPFFIQMRTEASIILSEIDTIENNELTEQLICKIKQFYENEKHLIFTNYCSEILQENSTLDLINSNFLEDKNIRQKYLNSSYDFSNKLTCDYENYKNFKKTLYYRMYLSSPIKLIESDMNDEILICAINESNLCYDIIQAFESIDDIKRNVENLEQDEISDIVKNIFEDKRFYYQFFSILKCEFIKKFFTKYLCLYEKETEYKFVETKTQNTECFKDIYEKFIDKYDKENENYKEFRNLIILKILPRGIRAYTVQKLKRYLINHVQFFVGKDIIEKDKKKKILEAYYLVILLHETEHYFRLLNDIKNEHKVFVDTPRGKEGGRLFIKYIFGIESISNVDYEQAIEILKNENWENHEKIKAIFKGQVENDDCEYKLNYFPKSISFYSISNPNLNKKFKSRELKK